MTAGFDEDAVRHWLVDYLVTTIGCSPEEVDVDAPLSDLSVSSSDAVVLSGELSELLGRSISPVEFWQYPTINALAQFLTGSQPESVPEAVVADDAADGVGDEPIAVIGVGCRFPGDIGGPDGLWRFLFEGGSAVTQVPQGRWSGFDGGSSEAAAALAATTRWGSFLSEVDAFDADFFEISPREAVKMDPQQRLLLEVTHEALEHAGIAPPALRHTETGVFVGACQGEYGYLASADLSEVDAWSGTGGALSIIANRVSYVFDLRGPSVTVDTACSSSLVAVHLACQSLRTGDASMALAGGVNLLLSPVVTRSFDEAEAMSPTGRCHAFDAAADGFVRGEGAGVVVLKRLTDAVRDGDRVLAVVRGSAVNQDGRSNGLMAPNPAAQMAVLRAAYAHAGVEPREVDYVEAHGTGTLLGDPIEARALGTVLGRGRRPDAPLLIGSVKSNLGHLEAAAGVAGFIKAVLAVQRGVIPANLHFHNPNPHIPFDSLRLKVIAEHTDWPGVSRARRAGVSSFGFGGTNAHVVVEQAPDPAPSVVAPPPVVSTVVVSGKSEERIAVTAGALADWMEGEGAGVGLADVAHTLNHHRTRHPLFATVCARDRVQAVTGLRALAAGYAVPGVVGPHRGRCRPGVVFVYSGQGSQWAGMGRQLLADEPAFAAAVAELEPVFVEQVGFSLQQVLAGGEPVSGIAAIQPVLVGMQLALTALWRSYGVTPAAVIGHSMGEVSAAVVAGALTPAQGLAVIATRSRLMARLSGQGAMALLELDPDSTEALIADYAGVTLAVYASPRQTVIAGAPEQVDAVMAVVDAQNRLARRIEVDVASHHPTIDPILPELRAALADLSPATPRIPLISTTDSTPGAALSFDADYWVANLRNPVRFSHALNTAATEHATFIEVSPHPLLTHAITDTLTAHTHHHSLPTLQRNTDDTLTFHTNLNATHTQRPPTTEHADEPHPQLPPTPWRHTHHWISVNKRADGTGSAPRPGTLLGGRSSVATTPPAQLWQARLVPDAKPYPGSHRIQGVEVVPVSVLLQTLSTAAAEIGASTLSDVRFEHPIVVDQPRIIQVVATDEALTLSSSPAEDTHALRWVRHISAQCCRQSADRPSTEVFSDAAQDLVGFDPSSVTELQRAWGVEGQPFPWSIDSWQTRPGELHADVALPQPSTAAMLDAAVHVARMVDITNPRLMVPAGVGSIVLGTGPVDARGHIEVCQRRTDDDDLVVDIAVRASDGNTCVDIRALRYTDVDPGYARATHTSDPRTLAHAIEWERWTKQADPAPQPGVSCTVAVVGNSEAAQDMRDRLAGAGHGVVDTAEARCVLYVAEPGTEDVTETVVECAARLTAEVADLVRRLTERDDHQPATLWIITRGVREGVTDSALRQSCLWGLAGVIDAEQPQLWGGLIDTAADDDISACASALSTLLTAPTKSILALREGEFLAPRLAPVSGQPVRDRLRCRPDASYLITGGTGSLGLLMAEWLADRGARRLILAGRTPVPPRRNWDSETSDPNLSNKIRAIRALEARGVSVDTVAVEVGSLEALQRLLRKRDMDGAPPIRGVIHAAGITESQLLTEIADDSLRRTMWPKVAGAEALHSIFLPGDLDFFFLTASAGSVFGIPGQAAYAAANAYLDCLARARCSLGDHTVSLDWVAWQGLGFAADAQIVDQELQRLGSRPLAPDEAFAAWEHVDRYDVAQAVIAPLSSMDQNSSAVTGMQAGRTPLDAWSQMSPAELRSELETGIRAILTRELGLPDAELESDRPFAELGLNSVMAMSIRREAEQLVGIELSATMLWNHPTIASLTEFLARKFEPETKPEEAGDVDSEASVLDGLFESAESASAGSEGLY
jgi:phthiocerol/phenolphthiocerol synthesis type-I polyketide synthase A